MCVCVFVSAWSISVSPFSVASVASVFVSIQLLISVSAAVPVMMFMINVASITLVISGRCPAAVSASVWGIAPQAPPCGGVSGSGLASAALQAGGAQRVEEEAFVGAPQRTFQPSCRAHGLCSHAGSVSLPEELLHCTPRWINKEEKTSNTVHVQGRRNGEKPRTKMAQILKGEPRGE